MLHYKLIEIFTSEGARWNGRPLSDAIVEYVRDLKIAARTMVTRATQGSYESGEISTRRIEVLSYNIPIRITIVIPGPELDRILPKIDEMVEDGVVAVQDLNVVSHRTHGNLIPAHTRVCDIMTRDPQKVGLTTPLDEVARRLLSSTFTGLPVVDENNRPVGVIAQGDLIYKANMPMRIGLLAQSDQQELAAVLESLAPKRASEIMTKPAVIIEEEKLVADAVKLMLEKGVKRLPVVDRAGKLKGMLSRVDVFHTIMRECPDWMAFQDQGILVDNLRFASDIMRSRSTYTVLPDTPVEEVMRIIGCNDIQRVCVLDEDGHFLGLISDRDLLVAFSSRHPGIRDYFMSKVPFSERGRKHRELRDHLRARTASEIMNTGIVTIREDAPVEDAVRLMLEQAIKRLPVLDAEGKFKGMISRDSLLRKGFAGGGNAG
jgi:CBS domain-containing protein